MPENKQTLKLENLAVNAIVNHGIFNKINADFPFINEKIWLSFLQAVIDDQRDQVKTYLDKYPELLMMNPLSHEAKTPLIIESQKTWQKFYAEPAAMMAAKRHQLKMMELLLPYFDKLPQTQDVIKAKADAISGWKVYEIQIVNGIDEIVIPQHYADYAQYLIDVFQVENFPNGAPGVNGVPYNVRLRMETESALSSLLDILVPKNAVKLDDHIDAELFLLALYKKAYPHHLTLPILWKPQLDAFCRRAEGLAQSALIPEIGEIFCEGFGKLLSFMDRGREISIGPDAKAHKLKNDQAFYRQARNSRTGAGFDFFTGLDGLELVDSSYNWLLWWHLNETMISNNNRFSKLEQQFHQQQDLNPVVETRSRCVML